MTETRWDDVVRVYQSTPGGQDTLEWFQGCCDFHDAAILGFELRRSGTGALRLFWWTIERTGDFSYESTNHATVIFEIEGISDLSLSGFSRQNVIGSLSMAVCPKDPERKNFYDFNATDSDYHLEIEHCYGMSGFVRCNRVSIRLEPGRPADDVHKPRTATAGKV